MAQGSLAVVLGMGLKFGRTIGEWPASLWVLVPIVALCVLGAAIWVRSALASGPHRGRRRGGAAALAVVCVLLLVAAGCPVGPLSFGSRSVCGICGAVQSESHSMMLPLVSITHYTESSLSEFARSAGLVGDHEHKWMFAHGVGRGLSASGGAMGLHSVLSGADAREFLAATVKWRGVPEATEWLRVLLTPDRDFGCPGVAVLTSWHAGGTTDRAIYEYWRKNALDTLSSDFPAVALPAEAGGGPPGLNPAR